MLPVTVFNKLISLITEDQLLPNDLIKSTQSFYSKSGHFPPYNISIVKGKADLVLEFALAGYTKEDIGIEFQDDKLRLKLKGKESNSEYYDIQRGISISKSDSFYEYVVPFSKYDVAKTSSEFKDGLLTINIPLKESASPIEITIK